MNVNLKELNLEQLKAFAWDLQTAAQQYSQFLLTVNNEINARLQQEAAVKQQLQQKAVKPEIAEVVAEADENKKG